VRYTRPGQSPGTDPLGIRRKVGTWTTIKFSGAIPANERNRLLERVRQLSDAVKSAREEANSLDVEVKKTGEAVLNFIFRPA